MALTIAALDTALQNVAKLVNTVKDATSYYSTQSLPDVTKLTRVEPLLIVSKDCVNLKEAGAIAQSMLNIFSGYYLQSIDMLTRVQNVNVVRILDRLNPNRDASGFLLSERVTRESAINPYKFSLDPSKRRVLSYEASDDAVKASQELVNLSAGKLLNVVIAVPKTLKVSDNNFEDTAETEEVTLAINVRLIASSVPNTTLVHLLSQGSAENEFNERFQTWLSGSGRIRFVQDLIFCQDLVDETKKASMSDKSGTMTEVLRRVANAKKYGLITKNPSLAAASSLYVISKAIASEVEAKLGKFTNPKSRAAIFEKTYAMVIAVVDAEWESVTFYTRGIEKGTEVSFGELKGASQRKGTDIADIMKMLAAGSQLSL